MAKQGKRVLELRKKVDPERDYEPDEGLTLVKELANAKFDETIEAHLRMGVDPRHADQMVRGSIILPAGTGKQLRVLAFAQADKAREAPGRERGVHQVGYPGADDGAGCQAGYPADTRSGGNVVARLLGLVRLA